MHEKLKSLFEAARWAPSSYNNQPWHFMYGIYGTDTWDKLLNTLMPFNQQWASHAGALILVLSRTTFEKSGKPARTHSFDTGMAVAQLLLQATHMNLVTHPMSGFDIDKVRTTFAIPDDYSIEAIIAIGEKAPSGNAQKEFVERDKKPATRKKSVL